MGRRGWSNYQGWGKERFKRSLPNFRSDVIETELRTFKLFSRIVLDKPDNNHSFPYKNHCKHYKNAIYILFTLTKFCLKHTLLFWRKIKFAVIAVFLSKLDHWLTFVQCYILQDYSSVRIGFSMINKFHTLPSLIPC